jgi:hypothetical protein
MEALEAHNSKDSSPAAAEEVNFHSRYFCHNSGVYFNPHQLRLVSVLRAAAAFEFCIYSRDCR